MESRVKETLQAKLGRDIDVKAIEPTMFDDLVRHLGSHYRGQISMYRGFPDERFIEGGYHYFFGKDKANKVIDSGDDRWNLLVTEHLTDADIKKIGLIPELKKRKSASSSKTFGMITGQSNPPKR